MILEIKNLIKRYGDFLAVDNVSFSVKEGEIFGLIGPNGAGKSTIMNCIIGTKYIDSGNIKIFERDMKDDAIYIKKNIGIVPQDISIYDDLSTYDNVMYFGKLYGLKGKKLKEYVQEALEFSALWDKRKNFPNTFSKGMRRRLNIACGIVHKPKLVIMDEPTESIDPKSRSHILDGIEKLNKSGTTIIYTSHYMVEVERICSDIAIIDHGRLIAMGNKDELKNMVAVEEKLKIKLSQLNYNIIEKLKDVYGVEECSIDGECVYIISKKGSKNLGKIIDLIVSYGIEILDINIEKPSIEDVFLTLTGRIFKN